MLPDSGSNLVSFTHKSLWLNYQNYLVLVFFMSMCHQLPWKQVLRITLDPESAVLVKSLSKWVLHFAICSLSITTIWKIAPKILTHKTQIALRRHNSFSSSVSIRCDPFFCQLTEVSLGFYPSRWFVCLCTPINSNPVCSLMLWMGT